MPCQFHTDNGFMPLFGLGVTKARVHAWPSGAGYTEIPRGGGWASQGCEPTIVCVDCTSSRVAICRCPKHEMAKMSESEDGFVDFETAIQELLDAKTREDIEQAQAKFCAICPRPAAWMCTRHVSETSKGGCGLRLCEICNVVLIDAFGGVLDDMIEKMDVDPEFYPSGLRADARFYHSQGLMMKQVQVQE